MDIILYNTLTRKKEIFKPLKEKEMNIEEYVYHSLLIFREVIEANMVLLFYNHAYELYTKRNLL